MSSWRTEGYRWISGLVALSITVAIGAVAPVAAAPAGAAASGCAAALTRDRAAQLITLTADCATETAIPVQDGWTFDGGGYTIQPLDEAGEPFAGGVIVGEGAVVITNVAIDGSRLAAPCDDTHMAYGVELRRASGLVSGVRITNLIQENSERVCSIGIDVAGPVAADAPPLVIAGNTISNVKFLGIRVRGGATASIAQNTISDVVAVGISVIDASSRATISGNTLQRIVNAGIFGNEATLTVMNNTIADARFGVDLQTGATAEISDNTILRPAAIGISFSTGATGTVTANRISAATDSIGVQLGDGAFATLRENQLRGGKAGVVASGEQTKLTMERNSITGTRLRGVDSVDGVSITMTGDVIRGTKVGVKAGRLSHASLRELHVEQAEVGIEMSGPGVSGEILDSTISDTSSIGILTGDQAAVDIEGNRVEHSRIAGIFVTAGMSTITIRDNLVIDTGASGIVLTDATGTVVEGNQISGPGYGIAAGGARLSLHGNTVREVKLAGIMLSEAMDVVIQSNVIESGAPVGIAIGDSRNILVVDNTVAAPESVILTAGVGIGFADVDGAWAFHNRVSGYFQRGRDTGCGIQVTGNTRIGNIAGNTFPAPGNRVNECLPPSPAPGAPPPATPVEPATPVPSIALVRP